MGTRALAAAALLCVVGPLVVSGCGPSAGGHGAVPGSLPRQGPRPPEYWRDGLASDDLLEVIATLDALAEAGPVAREAEDKIAALLAESARGKILSRWCFRALSRISDDPSKYVAGYMAAAGWEHTVEAVEMPDGSLLGEVGGPAPDTKGPEIPQELAQASREAWVTGVDATVAVFREGRDRHPFGCVGAMGAPEEVMVPRLTKVMLDEKVTCNVRQRAARRIGAYGHSDDAMAALLKGIKSPDAGIRRACAAAISLLAWSYDYSPGEGPPVHPCPKKAVTVLAATLKDREAGVRMAAAQGLGQLRRELRTVPSALLEVMKSDPDCRVRASAANALGRVAHRLRETDAEAYAEAEKAAEPALTELLRLRSRSRIEMHLVMCAAGCIAQFPRAATRAIPELRRLLQDATVNPLVKETVACTLGALGTESREAVPDILRCLREERFDRELGRQSFVVALGKIGRGGDDVESALLRHLSSRDAWLRFAAADSLGRLARDSENVTEALERLLDDEDQEVRAESAKALKRIRARAAGMEAGEVQDVF